MMKNAWHTLVRFLIGLIAFAIPIEHRYDKAFRFFSLTLIPEGLQLPDWFGKRLYYYPSDCFAILLFLVAAFGVRVPLRKLLWEKGLAIFWLFIVGCGLSIYASPLYNYPVAYSRLLQLICAGLIFGTIASMEGEERTKVAKIVLKSIIIMATIQSVIAIAQYFYQAPIGLKKLGEPDFSDIQNFCFILVQDGVRWTFDRWQGLSFNTKFVARVMGTFPHPNVLGGFLTLASLLSFSFYAQAEKWKRHVYGALISLFLFAMTLTFSRAAIFSFVLGCLVWIYVRKKSSLPTPFLSLSIWVASSASVIGFLFHEQLLNRGGILNYNYFARQSDAYRLFYQNLSFKMIKDHPISGVGYNLFTYRLSDYLTPENNPYGVLGAVHNIYLLICAESGIVSLLLFLTFLALLFRAFLRASSSPYGASLLAIFISFLFIGGCDFYPILFQQGRLMFFLPFALLAAYGSWEKRRAYAVQV